jgi:hypothetical protein
MPDAELHAIREVIASNPRGFYDTRPEIFGAREKAADALKGMLGTLQSEHPALRFLVTAQPDTLRSLGLGPGYVQVRCELIFVRVSPTTPTGCLRLSFEPRLH